MVLGRESREEFNIMNTKNKFKICRRLGYPVFDKCLSQKFMLSEAKHAKNQKRRPKQLSGYGQQLIEKQKVRFLYGVSEKQLQNYVKEANKQKIKAPVIALNELLESRLDNILYRAGLTVSRLHARQLAAHGLFVVNGKRTRVPSQSLKQGDTLSIREGAKSKKVFTDLEKKLKNHSAPSWISFDGKSMTGVIKGIKIVLDPLLDFNRVLEYYSR